MLAEIYVQTAFLQTGSAERDFYVITLHERANKSQYFLLLTARHGLVNESFNWQVLSDLLVYDICLTQLTHVPSLFNVNQDGLLSALVIKIVRDILMKEKVDTVYKIVAEVYHKQSSG